MIIQAGYGNQIVCTFVAGSKTLAIAGLYNTDFDLSSIKSIYNTTRSAYMYGGGSTASATFATVYTTGVPVSTITLSAVPASSADGDTLIVLLNVPDSVALYQSMSFLAETYTP